MQNPHEETTTEIEHSGPHIPALSGESTGFHLGSLSITNTMLSTWLFMVILAVVVWKFFSAATTASSPRLKAIGIDLIARIDIMLTNLFGDSKKARKFFPLLAGFFVFIFLANVFGLVLDLINLVFPKMHAYLRPINSDLNTTLVMGLTSVLVAQFMGVKIKGFTKHYKHYVVNLAGHGVAEKGVSLFIGWLHFIGEFIRVGSLSLRLFLNIFVGITLISVVVYIGGLMPLFGLGKFLTLPFWFFELLVAFLQAYIFMTLSGLYLKEAMDTHHH